MIAGEASTDRDPIAALLSSESFTPLEPHNLEEAGIPESLVEGLICKRLLSIGLESGRSIAEHLCLPFGIVEERLHKLRSRQLMSHRGAAALNDHVYALSEQGREFAQHAH